jgi:hypothetical protein
MPDVLVPVGRHFFQPADLQKALSVIPQDGGVGPHGLGAKAAIDSDGAHVALLYSVKNGAIVARGAFAYEWGHGYKVGADITFKL